MINQRNSAFTLIELMIVIAVIAILAGIMVPNFVRARQEAKLAACEQNLKNIGLAFEIIRTRRKLVGDTTRADSIGRQIIITPGIQWDELEGALPNPPPTCPCGGKYSLRISFNKGRESLYVEHFEQDAHKSLGITGSYPRYDVEKGGIVEHP